MFGGFRPEDDTPSPDTWVSVAGGPWSLVPIPASQSWPVARTQAAMFELGGSVILFGGADMGGNALGDTWAWNGTTWTELHPSNPPPVRSAAVAVNWNNSGLLFGGLDTNFDPINDTWLWNGSDWSNVTPADPALSPPVRSQPVAATLGNNVVLFGGQGTTVPLGDTWSWDGAQWNSLNVGGPPARYGAAATSF
jgi:hypothetical protein